MAKAYQIYIWKKAAFLRLLLPLIAGIILEFYFQFSFNHLAISGIILIAAFTLYSFLPQAFRFKYKVFQGMVLSFFLLVFGLFITWQKDIRNSENWYGNHYSDSSFLIVTIAEPPIEKSKSYKALVSVEAIVNSDTMVNVHGNLLLYLAKDSGKNELQYGDQIIIKKKIQEIKSSGNPGAFDYAQYSSFRQLYHQVYLKKKEWVLLKEKNKSAWQSFIFNTRETVVKIIDKNISGNDESSIAKALLIGYKVDLEKDLVQAYSNAGVVHLIAISGLHMGIIYGVLLWLFSKMPLIKNAKGARLILVIICLWLFALLTGASPSVLRAAVMFSFIVAGNAFNTKSSVYNSLSASAFLLLCFNPFILWDVGFQLSYLAVLGIVLVQKPISNWLYFKNKILQHLWQLAAVSLAAQLFTFPVCLYYFHQLPLLFLFANLIAIPLATVILWGCLILVFLSPAETIAIYLGKCIFGLLWLLNQTVTLVNSIPFSLWEGFSISIVETLLMYAIACSFAYATMHKNKLAFKMALSFSLLLAALSTLDKWKKFNQKKMIVYNVPAHQAVDFIIGNKYSFVGSADLIINDLLIGFNVKPSRVFFLANKKADVRNSIFEYQNFYKLSDKKILIVDTAIAYLPLPKKIMVDFIIFSKNAQVNLANFSRVFDCKQYIFDASNSSWKIEKWKKECEELHLRFHSVSEQGAFVTDL